MSLTLPVAAVIGSGVSSAANLISNEVSFRHQKELNRLKYTDMIDFARQNGATPTSIISGITGSAGGSVPTASTSNNPVSDLGSSLNSAIQASAAQRQAGAAEDQAQAALTTAETERQLGLMKLRFEPKKYFADIRKSLAQAFESTQNGFLHRGMVKYYDELTKDVQQVRPWKIAGLRQSLLNDMATFGKILQETATSKAQEGFFKSGSVLNYANARLADANTNKVWTETINESLKGFRLQWENDLLFYGIDPTKSFWENTGRLLLTDPRMFKERMDCFISGLNLIDGKLQENLGEHYKRNAALGYGLYKLDQWHQSRANARSYRFNNAVSAISRFIPFTNIGASAPVPMTDSKLPWYLDDGRF